MGKAIKLTAFIPLQEELIKLRNEKKRLRKALSDLANSPGLIRTVEKNLNSPLSDKWSAALTVLNETE